METKVDSREKEGNRTCRRHMTEKKSQDRIHPGPSDRIRSRTTERPNERLFSIKNGLLWNMTV